MEVEQAFLHDHWETEQSADAESLGRFEGALAVGWLSFSLNLEQAFKGRQVSDLILMARKKKPSGANKKERRRQKGIKLDNEVNHERNAGIAHGLIIGGRGGVRVQMNRGKKTDK